MLVEKAGRVCYKSERDEITPKTASDFSAMLLGRQHESVIEHASASVHFVVDRGVSHELVRHRLASFSQESTRYCNYSKDKFGNEITVIQPCYLERGTNAYEVWYEACSHAELAYFNMLSAGCPPEQARAVLPNSLKTEIVVTANLREWRHIFKLRTSTKAHVQMREVMIPLYEIFAAVLPSVFSTL